MNLDRYHYREESAAPDAPLLFAFHGTGGDEDQIVPLARQIAPAAHVIAPRGDVSEGGALRFFRRRAEGVYDMADLRKRSEAMAGFIDAHRRRLRPSRTFGVGYSNGANILASVVFARSGQFDDIVLMHPLIPWKPEARDDEALRVLITAGRRDPICPPALTEALAAYFRAHARESRTEWHEGGHELRLSEIAAATRFLA